MRAGPPSGPVRWRRPPRRRAALRRPARAGRELHQTRHHRRRLVGAFGQRLRRQVEQLRLPALHLSIRRAAAHRGRRRLAQRAAGRHRTVRSGEVLPVAPRGRELARAAAHRSRRRSGVAGDHGGRIVLDRRRDRPLAAALLGRRRVVGAAGGAAGQRAFGGSSAGHRPRRYPAASAFTRPRSHGPGRRQQDAGVHSRRDGRGRRARHAARAALRHVRRKVAARHSYI